MTRCEIVRSIIHCAAFRFGPAGLHAGGYADDGLMSQVPTAPAVQEIPAEPENGVEYLTQENANILWTCIAAFLVFSCRRASPGGSRFYPGEECREYYHEEHAGFSLGSIIFLLVGFGIMFGAQRVASLARMDSACTAIWWQRMAR